MTDLHDRSAKKNQQALAERDAKRRQARRRYTADRTSPYVEWNLAGDGWVTIIATPQGTCAVASDRYGNPLDDPLDTEGEIT